MLVSNVESRQKVSVQHKGTPGLKHKTEQKRMTGKKDGFLCRC